MRQDDGDQERGLEQAITELRQDVDVRVEWREALDRELLQIAPMQIAPIATRHRPGRRWQFTPVTAIAAALVCMISGAALNDVIRRSATSSRSADVAVMPVSTQTIGVRFSVMAPGAHRVSLVGDFNGWNADATPLELARDGQTWTTLLPLAAGRHAYAFVIDGQVVRDPTAPQAPEEDFGVPNSLVLVSNTGTMSTSR